MIKFLTLCWWIVLSFNLNASNHVTGTFDALEPCPAYLSKNNKTNPDNLLVQPGKRYEIKEINKTPPDWVRIEFSPQNLRWVNVQCGAVEYTGQGKGCEQKPGLADAHVIAFSSQPGFCETYGYEAGKPECMKLSRNSYQANHLTLHGLWPNQAACGQRYGFCGVKPRANHCDYFPLDLTPAVAANLKKVMPSYNYGSCLERHEWNKHGSCQILTVDDYFTLAIRLLSEIDESELGHYLTNHRGETVKLAKLRELWGESYGKDNLGKLRLGCKNGILVDVYVQLPALIPFDQSLVTLIEQAPNPKYHDACSGNVVISDFTKDSWI